MTNSNQFQTFLGLCLVALIAAASYGLLFFPWMASTGLSSLVIAILLGIFVGNSWHHPASWSPGIQFAAKRLLRIAIVFYGFRVTFQEIASVGVQALTIDILIVTLTLLLGYWIGHRVLKLDKHLALLITAGSAICGAAAVLAVEDVLKSEPYKTAVAISTVVLFGTLSMFLYPMLQRAGLFGFTETQFGIYVGASVHEVAQALVAGTNISVETGKIAVIVKMIRVLLLVPVILILSLNPKNTKYANGTKSINFTVPWFALGFVAMIGFNSLHLLSPALVDRINQMDILLLTMAMAAIGVETKFSKIKQVGLHPFYLALILFAWLMSFVFILMRITF